MMDKDMRSDRKEAVAAMQALLGEWKSRSAKLLQNLPEPLLVWFRANARDLPWRKNRDPYRVWLSEIMLQQTRVEAVKGYYARFLAACPTVQALADASEDTILKLWEGLGYYSRARNLHKAAKRIAANDGRFPTTYDKLRELPGVGDYTAGAIASICFDCPTPAVDGNVLRVISRLTELPLPISEPAVKRAVFEALEEVYPRNACGEFTQALMELGAVVCVPNGAPHCVDCPLSAICRASKNGTVGLLPLKAVKKERTIEEKTVLILTDGEAIAVCRREERGLLAGLWQLPDLPGWLSPEAVMATLEEWGISPIRCELAYFRKHIFTHREWHMCCYAVQIRTRSPRFTWAEETELAETIALPTAYRICLERPDE